MLMTTTTKKKDIATIKYLIKLFKIFTGCVPKPWECPVSLTDAQPGESKIVVSCQLCD